MHKTIFISLPLEDLQTVIIDCVNVCLRGNERLKSKEFDLVNNNLLNIKQASKFLNLATSTIYSKCSRGQLPYIKKAKKLYFSKDELENYLKSGKVFTNDEIIENASNYLQKKAEQ